MGVEELETLAVDLEGNFTAEARAMAQGAEQLEQALEDFTEAATRAGKSDLDAHFMRLAGRARESGSAIAAAKGWVLDYATAAISNMVKLASVYDLVANRARALRNAEAARDQEAFNRANRLPTELQSPPPAIDWMAALESQSRKAGSAIDAAAKGALDIAANTAEAEGQARKLASVYDLVARRAAEASKAEAAAEQEAFARANRTPTALQSSPPKIDWGAAFDDVASKSGSAMGAAKKGAIDAAAKIAEQRAALQKLSSVYELVEKRARAAAKAEAAADQEAFNKANRLPTALQSSPKAATGFQNVVGIVERLFGQKAAGSLVAGAGRLSEASDKLGQYAPLLTAGGKALGVGAAGAAAAAAAILAAAVAITYAAGKLLYAGLETGIQMSGKKQVATRALSKLDKSGKGEADYQLSVKLAAELGMDDATPVIDEFKRLLQAGFSREEIPLYIKAAADLGAVKGDEKAKAFLEQITKAANKGGKASLETLNALAEAGVNTDDVLKRLAKKGETIDQVKARLKTNQIEAKALAKAAAESVEAQMGGIAGKGFFAKLNSVKLGLAHLLDGFDLTPAEEALDNVSKVLKGPLGAELKTSLTKLFDTLIHTLVDPFRGKEGEERLNNLVKGVIKLAEVTTAVLQAIAPHVERVIDGFSRFAAWDVEASPVLRGLTALKDIVVGIFTLDPAQLMKGWNVIFEMLGLAPAQASQQASAIGTSIVDGIVSGIVSGQGGAIGAIVGVVQGMIDAAKNAQDSHSPSKKYEQLSKWNMQGLAKGANDNAGIAADATAGAVEKSLGAAGDASAPAIGSAGGPGGGAGPGGAVTIIVQVTATPGTTAAHAQAMGDAAGTAAHAAWLRGSRRGGREAREGRRAA